MSRVYGIWQYILTQCHCPLPQPVQQLMPLSLHLPHHHKYDGKAKEVCQNTSAFHLHPMFRCPHICSEPNALSHVLYTSLKHVCQCVVKDRKVSVMVHHCSPQDLLLLSRHKAHNSRVSNCSMLCLTLCMHLRTQPGQSSSGNYQTITEWPPWWSWPDSCSRQPSALYGH